ncbi:hypothetical protein C0389_07125 [bacterium]|nr:hypothetical protein [bacterium]
MKINVTNTIIGESKQSVKQIILEINMNRLFELSLWRRILTLFCLLGLVSSITFADELRLIREKSFQMKDWQNVYVNASGADVKVESWDKQEVYVKIFSNRRAEEKMTFNVYQENEVVKVIVKRKGSFFNWFGGGISVRIEIMTPKNYNANVETSGGDIITTNTDGKLKVETSGGEISLFKHKGAMDLSTSGGDIICKETTGDLNAETSGGDIKIDLSEGKLYASTSGGDIIINYSGMNKGFQAETSGGDIQVKLPANFKAKAHFETSGGSITNNFSNSRSERVRRGEVDAEFNGGGEILKLETSGGDIRVDQK